MDYSPAAASLHERGSIGGHQVKKIDYLIAAGSDHYKIPFEIEHIPLPKS
jgi:hypothetical protein